MIIEIAYRVGRLGFNSTSRRLIRVASRQARKRVERAEQGLREAQNALSDVYQMCGHPNASRSPAGFPQACCPDCGCGVGG